MEFSAAKDIGLKERSDSNLLGNRFLSEKVKKEGAI